MQDFHHNLPPNHGDLPPKRDETGFYILLIRNTFAIISISIVLLDPLFFSFVQKYFLNVCTLESLTSTQNHAKDYENSLWN